MTPEQKFIKDHPQYDYFLVDNSLCEIVSGWEFKEDANDSLKDQQYESNSQVKYYRVWTRSYTKRWFNK